jgi:hypothetical protein
MSNDSTINPIFIDTQDVAGETAVSTRKDHITAIGVNANADNWVVILHDASGGNLIFDQTSAVTGNRGDVFPVQVQVTGIFATTLTNVDNVLVYRKAAV